MDKQDMKNSIDPQELMQSFMRSSRFADKFLEQRKVFLWGPVTDKSAERVVNQILFLDADQPGQPITFYINSPGGMVTSGLAMLDVMNLVASPVHTVCVGLAASMGAVLLSAGVKGQRACMPNARVMIHQPSLGGFRGTFADLEITAKEMQKTKDVLALILAQNCNKPLEQINKDFNRDYWMGAQESVEYGIVDAVSAKI
ncbi:MAG: ATP-dependent Clp protease proteolytic subunit [Chitinophagales bacterium]|jgi:ATP-dependent Clp protease protease subunit|nr:ATP-dependent Clp protease proteolytic subunit [Chitinophagales bacterium]MCC7058031.1 ATP-dependent Clp protease proteolytic subunit [Chitinophagales bacterium]MDA0199812.1 ATP-dependent Clp protease proteolytic subunit [Bacteroidota bacterium]